MEVKPIDVKIIDLIISDGQTETTIRSIDRQILGSKAIYFEKLLTLLCEKNMDKISISKINKNIQDKKINDITL